MAGCTRAGQGCLAGMLAAPLGGQVRVGGHGERPGRNGPARGGWTQPGADQANTCNVASAITSADVSKLGVAWTVPLTMPTVHTSGAYATTPVVVNGVVYVQDLDSDVFAISLASGKVLWTI
jgi:glucose dehydrogenase